MVPKRNFYLFFFLVIGFTQHIFAQEKLTVAVKYFKTIPNISIRALEAVSDSTAWFSANHGIWGYTENASKTWHIDSIKVDSVYPQFRSIAVLNDSTVLLLSVASPAYMFKTTNKGKAWRLVYKNELKNIFFDCMKFYDSKNGIAIGDPIGGYPYILKTHDQGETWNRINVENIPKADSGEACFAASNSNIACYLNHIWFVTGGMRSRVFHSSDFGYHFEVFDSPISKGGQLTGIFSVDFFNESEGVIGGGNYMLADSGIFSLAATYDGGNTWYPIKTKKPIFCSCVKFRTADAFFVTGSTGTYKCSIKSGAITELTDKSGASLKYNTLRFSPDKKTLWLAGDKGSIARIDMK